MVIDLLPTHEFHGIARLGPLVKNLQTAIVDLVPTPLDLGHLQADFVEQSRVLADVGKQWHGPGDQVCALHNGVRHGPHVRLERGDLEQHDGFGSLLHLVDRIVHGGDQVFDVTTVKGRNERASDSDEDLARDRIGLLFIAQDVSTMLRCAFPALQHLT